MPGGVFGGAQLRLAPHPVAALVGFEDHGQPGAQRPVADGGRADRGRLHVRQSGERQAFPGGDEERRLGMQQANAVQESRLDEDAQAPVGDGAAQAEAPHDVLGAGRAEDADPPHDLCVSVCNEHSFFLGV